MRTRLLWLVLASSCAAPAGVPDPTGDHGSERHADRRAILEQFTRSGGWLVSPVIDAPATRAGFLIDVEPTFDGPLRLEARGVLTGGGFGAWSPAAVTWERHPGRVLVAELDLQADGVQVRLLESELHAVVFMMWSAVVPEPRSKAGPLRPSGPSRLGLDGFLAGMVRPRSDWGARAPTCSDPDPTKTRLAVHHTVTPPALGGSATARLQQIQAYHMDANGWCDVGYHFLITQDGAAWEGRVLDSLGAHVLNNNTGNIGISLVGCFEPGACDTATYGPLVPPEATITKSGELARALAGNYAITVDATTLKGHRQHSGQNTSCPGENLVSRLEEIRTLATAGGSGTGDGVAEGVVWDLGRSADPSEPGNVRVTAATISVAPGDLELAVRADDAYWTATLAAGTYTFTARAPGYVTASRTLTLVGGGTQWASIGLVPEQPTTTPGTVQGVVWDASVTGGPADPGNVRVPGATITVQPGGLTATARAGDAYWRFDLDPGTYTITAQASGYEDGLRTVTIVSGVSQWASIGVTTSGGSQVVEVTAFVFDQAAGRSHGVSGATVQIGAPSAVTDAGGYAELSVDPGTYSVQVTHPSYAPSTLTRSFPTAGAVLLELGLGVEPAELEPEAPRPQPKKRGCAAAGSMELAALLTALARRAKRSR